MVFKGLSIHTAKVHSQSRTGGKGLIRETKIPVQELWLKKEGSLYVRGGVLMGHYGTGLYSKKQSLVHDIFW